MRLTFAEALTATGDPGAQAIIAEARDALLTRAANIDDLAMRNELPGVRRRKRGDAGSRGETRWSDRASLAGARRISCSMNGVSLREEPFAEMAVSRIQVTSVQRSIVARCKHEKLPNLSPLLRACSGKEGRYWQSLLPRVGEGKDGIEACLAEVHANPCRPARKYEEAIAH